ncbi:MAG: HEAT repeat domain-containing protein [Pyrinomonadaceae bacterium MAG19_C2-C3]|nr:HEAT repeat domain-containing protein [Pyrinomonadaceae bacterium MAG19_C2-C3]
MAQPSRFSFVESARRSLSSRSSVSYQSARCRTIALCVFAVMLLVGGLAVTGDVISGTTHAQQRRRPAATASSASQNTNRTNANTATQTKRITPLRTTDSPEGSRVTITSDAPLNDYAAYRSGNRFYVVIPGADASAVRSGARGRGFEDAQVQRRGNDAVLSFRLNPGAKARVNQRFNRLDVVFDTPGEIASNNSTQASANNQANTNQSRPTPTQSTANTVTQESPNQNTRDTARDAAAATLAQQRLLAARNAERDLAARNLNFNNAAPDDVPNPADASPTDAVNTAALPSTASTEASPEVSPTPATDEIAQARTDAPLTPATTVVNPAADNSSSFATMVATVVKSNPLWIMLAALGLAIGLFLFVRVARQSTVPPPALDKGQIAETVTLASDKDIVTPPKPLAAVAPNAGLLAASDAEPVTAPHVNTEAGIGLASAITASAIAAKYSEREDDEAEMSPSLVPVVGAPDESSASSHDEAATITAQPPVVIAPVDTEAVARELQNLLDGKEYSDEILRGANDAASRELVASELVAALSTRNIARRDQARHAYVAYGYFDDATRDLRHAKTPVARVTAARALGMSANPDATPPLITALHDKSPEVRRAAIDSLAALRDSRAVEPLTKMRRRENKRVIPYRVIDHAIAACTAVAATQLAADQPESGETPPTNFVTLAPLANFARVEPENPLDIMRQAQASQQALVDSVLKTPVVIEEPQRDVQAEDPTRQTEDLTHDATSSIETAAPEVVGFEVVQPEAAQFEIVEPEAVQLETVQTEIEQFEVVHPEPAPLEDDALPIAAEQAIEALEPLDSDEVLTEEIPVVIAPVEHLEQATQTNEGQIAPFEFISIPDSTLDSTAVAPPLSSPTPEVGSDDATAFDITDLSRPATTAPDSAEVEPEIETQAFVITPLSDAKQETAPEEWLDLDFNETPPTAEEEAYDDAPPPELPASALREMTLISATPDVVADDAADYREQYTAEIEPAAASSPSPGDDEDVSPFALELVPVSENVEAATSHELQAIAPTATTTDDELETVAEVDITHDEPSPTIEDEFEAEDTTRIPEALRARLANADARERVAAVAALGRMTSEEAVGEIFAAFDDRAVEVRNAAAQALHRATTDHTGAFTRALREASPERRRNIGAAIAGSGLATHALKNLTGESRERTYEAFSLLFLMAKAGEFTPLLQAIEQEPSTEVRLAVVKLLALSGQPEVLPAFRRLAVRGSLPPDVRSAVMEAVYQISNQPSNMQQRV